MKGQNMTSRTMNFLCLICYQRNRNVRYLTLALVESSVDQSREFCALAVGRNVRSLTFKPSVEPGVSGRTVGDRNRTVNVRCLTSGCASGTVRGCLAGLSKKKVSDVRYLTSVGFQKSAKSIHGRGCLERPGQEQHSFLLAGQEEGATTASCVGGKGCGFLNLRTSQSRRSAHLYGRSYRSVRRLCLARTHVLSETGILRTQSALPIAQRQRLQRPQQPKRSHRPQTPDTVFQTHGPKSYSDMPLSRKDTATSASALCEHFTGSGGCPRLSEGAATNVRYLTLSGRQPFVRATEGQKNSSLRSIYEIRSDFL